MANILPSGLPLLKLSPLQSEPNLVPVAKLEADNYPRVQIHHPLSGVHVTGGFAGAADAHKIVFCFSLGTKHGRQLVRTFPTNSCSPLLRHLKLLHPPPFDLFPPDGFPVVLVSPLTLVSYNHYW
jgi:hypothetical protein